jgi:hypothetical protein
MGAVGIAMVKFVPLGFKGLRVGEIDWRGELVIYSASLPFRWHAPVVYMERCSQCEVASPGKDCNCGIHASFHVGVVITEYLQTPVSFLALVEGRGDREAGTVWLEGAAMRNGSRAGGQSDRRGAKEQQ